MTRSLLERLEISIYCKTVVKSKSTETFSRKVFIWLRSMELIPESMKKRDKRQVNFSLRKLTTLYKIRKKR